jgi:hypothetical protein
MDCDMGSDRPIPNPALVLPLREIKSYRFENTGRGRAVVKMTSFDEKLAWRLTEAV